MGRLTRVFHRGLDNLFMEAFRLRRLHPPRLDLGPLKGNAHMPAGGVPEVPPLAIALPTKTRRVMFKSPVPGIPPPNDLLPLTIYPPKGPARGILVFSPFWQIPGPWALRPYLSLARKQGLFCVVYTPPDHMERTPKGYWSGERILSWDFPHMEQMLQLTAGELTAITAGLKQHGLPVYLMGLSLGGLYAAMAALNGAPIDALMLITPAADMQPSMAKTRIGRRYQAMLQRRGDDVPGDDELSLLGIPYRARSFDRPLPVDRIFLAHGIHDGVVPLGVVTALAKRWQVPLHAYSSGHMSLLFLEPAVQKDVAAFLAACLAGQPGSVKTVRQRAKARPARSRPLLALSKAVGRPLARLRGAARTPKGGLPPITPTG